MKNIFVIIIFSTLAIAWGCKEKPAEHGDHDHHDGHSHDAQDGVEVSSNQILYDEVMKIHDEVMPKVEDIHNRKRALKEQLTIATAEQKQAIEVQIARLDSAERGMMDWMHKFNPIPDSEGEEKAREYLEAEMEKIKKVREDILTALEEEEEK